MPEAICSEEHLSDGTTKAKGFTKPNVRALSKMGTVTTNGVWLQASKNWLGHCLKEKKKNLESTYDLLWYY